MTGRPESVTVECPSCGETYQTSDGASIDLSAGAEFSENDLHRVTHKTCPHCGHEVELSMLLIDRDGVFHLEAR